METVAMRTKTIFNKVLDFIYRVFRPKEKEPVIEHQRSSRFIDYLQNIDIDNDNYDTVETAVAVCDEAMSIAETRIKYVHKLKQVNDSIAALESYNSLNDEEVEKIKDLFSRFSSLARDRNHLRNQLEGFEHSLSFMRELEGEAPKAIPEIFEAEGKQRLFKQDLGYLEGEKADLIYEKERFQAGLLFIQKLSVGMCIFFGIALIVLSFLYISNGVNIILPMSGMVFLVIILSCLLYAFRRRIIFELELNIKKQSRAVELLNKKTVLYAHYTNFLNYEYKKYKIRNSAMLKNNLSDYKLYKHLISRLDSIRSIMYQTEAEIEEFFRNHKIYNPSLTVDKLIESVDLDNKKRQYEQLMTEKSTIEKNLAVMDNKHEKLWDVLTMLTEKDSSEEHFVQNIVRTYIDEAGKLINSSLVPVTEA